MNLILQTLTLLVVASAALAIPHILIYSATREYRHDSIVTATTALKQLGQDNEIRFDSTEDQTQFTDEILAGYDALLFLSNSGEVLDDAGKRAFQTYLNKGGNYIGIHAASACLFNTTFYQREVGALFDYHPEIQPVTFVVIDKNHPSTSALPGRWTFTEEAYNFRSDPRLLGARVLLSVDESSYTDTGSRKYTQGSPHPIAWCQERGAGAEYIASAGRSFYTSLGHLNSTWTDSDFLKHVLGGIQWTLAANTTLAVNTSGQVGAKPEEYNPSASGSTSNTPLGTTSTSASHSTLDSVQSMFPSWTILLVTELMFVLYLN